MKFTIDILGKEWTVKLLTEEEDERLKECMGFTDWTCRDIVIGRPPKETTVGDTDTMLRKVLRHEIIHAFLFECGLGDDWTHPEMGHDETMVDWLAYHVHTISTVCGNAEGELMMWLLEEQKHGRTETDPAEH